MANKLWCRHYRALTSFEECKAGISYKEVRIGKGPYSYPCLDRRVLEECSHFESFTEEEIAAEEAAISEFVEHMNRLEKRETDLCPYCGTPIVSLHKIVRCVYASPCNCRLWQGDIPQAWMEPATAPGEGQEG